jgi:hypothetical protein
VRRARWLALALALAGLALSGCETTAEKSAQLNHEAKHVTVTEKGLTIAHQSAVVKVLGATVLHGSEGAAVVVTLRNDSSHALREVPIAITVSDSRGDTLSQNNAPGLEGALVSLGSLAAHSTAVWVDDQVPAAGQPASVTTRVGQSAQMSKSPPRLTISSVRLGESPANGAVATATVSNRSAIAQRKLVVFAVARRAGKIVAAGRAVVPELSPGAAKPVELFLVGDSSGAQLQLSATATTFG